MSEPRPSLLRTLGWAAYLGMSWTWCIGMFLPILLMRDFGVWAFGVFAIPNVVGAAAMGWVLRRPGAAEDLRDRHRSAILWFSLVTLAFHLYWFLWMCAIYATALLPGISLGAALVYAISTRTSNQDADRTKLAMGVFGVSMLAFGALLTLGLTSPAGGSPTVLPSKDLSWLAPVCAFGFALCPYLDATFLQARSRATGVAGSIAFTLGFGVFFLLMIVFTFLYSGHVRTSRTSGFSFASSIPMFILGTHWFAQLCFTFHVHTRETTRLIQPPPQPQSSTSRPSFMKRWLWLPAAIAFVLTIMFVPAYRGLSLGEIFYRLFMTFYGLVFPAYVWLCMIPTRDNHAGTLGPRGRRKLVTLAAAVLLASPCFWMGFIERETWWLAPGLGIVLLSRLIVTGRRAARPGDDAFVRGGV